MFKSIKIYYFSCYKKFIDLVNYYALISLDLLIIEYEANIFYI